MKFYFYTMKSIYNRHVQLIVCYYNEITIFKLHKINLHEDKSYLIDRFTITINH